MPYLLSEDLLRTILVSHSFIMTLNDMCKGNEGIPLLKEDITDALRKAESSVDEQLKLIDNPTKPQ